jgi:hypothetical protein
LEIAHKESHGEVGGDPRDKDPYCDLAVDVCICGTGEGGQLENAGGPGDQGSPVLPPSSLRWILH